MVSNDVQPCITQLVSFTYNILPHQSQSGTYIEHYRVILYLIVICNIKSPVMWLTVGKVVKVNIVHPNTHINTHAGMHTLTYSHTNALSFTST